MKTLLFLLTLAIAGGHSFGQQKIFEGVVTYKTTIRSKIQDLPDNYARKLLATGETEIVYIKNGNYKHSSSLSDVYYRQKEKKAFYKFKNLDTLYYLDYSGDTSKVTDVVKNDAITRVNDIDCKSVTIKTAIYSTQFYYAPSIPNNPDFDRDNTLGHFDVYARETGGALWLLLHADYNFASMTDSCIRMEQKALDDQIFELPDLPVRKFVASAFFSRPRFPGDERAWFKYLEKSMDPQLNLKYVKLPKGESAASTKVMVKFMVMEDGRLTHIEVVNKDEVHPKLAQEAMRVIRESPNWIPGAIFGEKVMFPYQQPVVFTVKQE